MQNFDIVKTNTVKDSFRLQKIKSDFGVDVCHGNEHFTGSIDIPEKWQIGVIVGSSGTGKSTILNQLFGDKIVADFHFDDSSVIDNMPSGFSVEEIEHIFYAVGFGSVPSWTKPFSVLSNGEKMRVVLARAILERDYFAFDEFTSVVDRTVAKTMCIALCKCLKRYPNKKVILVSCHKDILGWLDSDWVFNTDTMQNDFFYCTPHEPKSNAKSTDAGLNFGECLGVITI